MVGTSFGVSQRLAPTPALVSSPSSLPEPGSFQAPAPQRDKADLLAVAILIAIPALIFTGADLFGGHLLLSGDNVLQNYPLRVLVGTDLRHGNLPYWDPFVWSGTPLLAGLNSSTFYPATLLFAVIPFHAAWVIGQVLVYSSVGVGTFLLFRSCGLSVRAAFLGAFSFTFAGAVLSQTSVHVDMGDGFASLPWALLAVRKLGEDQRWRWAFLFAAAFALIMLAGSPEALLDTAALCATFAVLRRSTGRGTWRGYASRLGAGALLAIGATAFLWIPALHFIAASQRPGKGELFASSYAFPARSGILGVIPYLEGGYSLFSQPSYFAVSNLGEVSFYVGILPVIAALTLLTRRWRSRIPAGELRCWYGVMVVGAVLAIAAGTQLEHILYHVPFFGSQRNSGRNIVDVDLAACALFAWWVDAGAHARASTSTGPREGRAVRDRGWTDVLTAFLPAAIVGVTALVYLARPETLWRWLYAEPPPPSGAVGSGDAIALAAGLALIAGILAVLRSRSTRTVWLRLVTAFVVVDVGLFAIGSAYAFAQQPPEAPHAGPLSALVKADLSPGGRYGIFDPDLFDTTTSSDAELQPDVGILDGIPSVSGYGAIVGAAYANDTGTQNRELISPGRLGAGQFRSLGLQVLVTLPQYFLVAVAAPPDAGGKVRPIRENPGSDPDLPGGNTPPPQPPLVTYPLVPGRSQIPAGGMSGWWFGTTLSVRDAVVALGRPSVAQRVRVGVLSPTGRVSWGAATTLSPGARTARFALGATGAGVEVQLVSGQALHAVRVAVTTASGRSYLIAGPLANAVEPGEWKQAGTASNFTVFRSVQQPRAAWLQPAGSEQSALPGSSTSGTAQVVSSSPDTASVEARAKTPALLVWSTAFDPGWSAETVGGAGQAGGKPLEVKRVGLVQGVEVPAGTTTVRFSYLPVGIGTGSAISAATFGALLIAGALYLIVRRIRRALNM
jgi:hypothetical protein